jgi:pilus assembly protein CpaB
MKKRAIIMLILSLLAGIAAVFLAARWMGQQAAEKTVQIVVAKGNLVQGQALGASSLEALPWPALNVPEGSFNDPKQLEGRVVRAPVYKGEAILQAKLAPVGSKAGLDSVIKDGKRAITVRVNEVYGVAGFLQPGSYVDLLVNMRDNKESPLSRIVLERVLVLAVAQNTDRPEEGKARVVNAVTLEVSPEDAEKIDLARNVGTLSLVLRNQVDEKTTATDGAQRKDLFVKESVAATPSASAPVAKAAPVRKAAPRPAVAQPQPQGEPATKVEVIRGLQATPYVF